MANRMNKETMNANANEVRELATNELHDVVYTSESVVPAIEHVLGNWQGHNNEVDVRALVSIIKEVKTKAQTISEECAAYFKALSSGDSQVGLKVLNVKLRDVKAAILDVIDSYDMGMINEEQFTEQRAALVAQRREVEDQIRQYNEAAQSIDETTNCAKMMKAASAYVVQRLNDAQQVAEYIYAPKNCKRRTLQGVENPFYVEPVKENENDTTNENEETK